MTHPLLSRTHLEALLIAIAIVNRPARDRLRDVDRDRVSVPAWALLAQLADPAVSHVSATTKGQEKLGEYVNALTVADLCFYELDTLIALVNQLPERAARQAAWERDLDAVSETAA